MVEAAPKQMVTWRELPRLSTSAPNRESLPPAGEIHLYLIPLQQPAETIQTCASLLSAEEKDKANRFKFNEHRRRYLVAHGFLRTILSAYAAVEPSSLKFEVGQSGKPSLAGEDGRSGLQFNLSHSEELALAAVGCGMQLGVDIEQVRVLKDVDELVARFFSRRESTVFRDLPAEQKPAAFFNLWTRKEALLKATGEGIANSLHLVEVTFLPHEPARLLAVPDQFGQATEWHLEQLRVPEGYAGAVASRPIELLR